LFVGFYLQDLGRWRTIFGICAALLAVSILGVPGYSIMGQISQSGRENGLHKHDWIGGGCNGWDLTFSPITEGFKDQIYQRHFSWNDFNIFMQHIFVARLWNFVEKFAHYNRQFFWFYPSSYYPII
jgi:hypothetical protein